MRPWLFRAEAPFLGDLSVPAYFFMLMLAFLIAVSIVIREARRDGAHVIDVLDLSLVGFAAGLIGSRLAHVFFESAGITLPPERTVVDLNELFGLAHGLCQWAGETHAVGKAWNLGRYYLLHPHMVLAVWNGGIVYYGGLLLAVPVCLWFCRRRNLPFWSTADLAAPAIITGLAFGRGGCFQAGCCYGIPAVGWSEPLGVFFSSSQVDAALRGVALHPTQIYEVFATLCIFVLLLWRRRHKQYDGQVFVWLFVAYGIWRPLVELIRGDSQRGMHFGLSTSQIISACLILGALAYSRRLRARPPSFA